MNSQKKCSILLLCGYLGSGKTTLIQHILKTQNEFKVAVIQNEFSDEMGIEAPLVQDSKGEIFDKFYELPNGCICCSAKSDLLTAIDYFLQTENYNLDFILVETNGLADPSSTIKTFWFDEELKFPATLKSIISIVDGERFKKLQKEEIFMRQLVFADTILINKLDKNIETNIDEIEKELKNINPLATLHKTAFCRVDFNSLLNNSGTFEFNKNDHKKIEEIFDFPIIHKHNDTKFITLDYKHDQIEFDTKDIERKIGTLLWEKHEDSKILRIKGIISVKNDDFAYSLQAVDDIFELKRTEIKWSQIPNRYSKILFIGEKIDKLFLEEFILRG